MTVSDDPTGRDPTLAAGEAVHRRLQMLDGWRAISIVAVLAGHMLPLGPKAWRMNAAIAANGMSLFFTLSGFLIVSILLRDPSVGKFLIRRFARILPLAWIALLLALPFSDAHAAAWFANFLFYANLPPLRLQIGFSHFWSLCLEMQFYVAIALLVLAGGRRGLILVPFAALSVTILRIATGEMISIVSWQRADEILAGGILALIIHCDPGGRASTILSRLPFWPIAVLTLFSTRPELPALNYARPYLSAAMVGITILRPVPGVSRLLESRIFGYIAKVSYALYIIHPFTKFGWLGLGHGWALYAKRPLSFFITFGLAHVSTFYFERRFIVWSHQLTSSGKSKL